MKRKKGKWLHKESSSSFLVGFWKLHKRNFRAPLVWLLLCQSNIMHSMRHDNTSWPKFWLCNFLRRPIFFVPNYYQGILFFLFCWTLHLKSCFINYLSTPLLNISLKQDLETGFSKSMYHLSVKRAAFVF